jgi:hypothetical protein
MPLGQYSGTFGMFAGGIIGGIIGYFTPLGAYQGAMLGASIGGMAGGIAGQVFWPIKQDILHPQPPKPGENRVQISTFGAPLPIVYDDEKIAGNIIYMSDFAVKIDRSRHRQDGVRYYEMTKTYSATFAISFCEGPIKALARLWVNGKIFVDFRDPASPHYPTGGSDYASGNLDTSIARSAVFFSIHFGNPDQTADATMSGILGAAETPSYRGVFYITFINFPVGEFGGIPTIHAEPVDTDEVKAGSPGINTGYA